MKIYEMLWYHLRSCLGLNCHWKIQQGELCTKRWWGEEKELCNAKYKNNTKNDNNNKKPYLAGHHAVKRQHENVVTTPIHFEIHLVCMLLLLSVDMCDPNWHLSRVGLITSAFACSILVLILAVIIPFLLAAHWLHGKFCMYYCIHAITLYIVLTCFTINR